MRLLFGQTVQFLIFAAILVSCSSQTTVVYQQTEPNSEPDIYRVAYVVTEARNSVHNASDITPLLRRAFIHNLERGYRQAARDSAGEWAEQIGRPDLEDILVEVVDTIGFPDQARRATLVCAMEYPSAREICMSLFYDAVIGDNEGLGLDPIMLTSQSADRLEQIHGNSSVLFKVRVDGHTVAAFKPLQEAPLTNIRGEIASYRLCELINCAISIPQNREAWIRDEDFIELARVETVEGNAVDRLEELDWFDSPNGQILYGTWKEWVPGFTNFPLEMTEIWRPLVDPEVSFSDLQRMNLTAMLRPLAEAEDISYQEIMDRVGGMTPVDFALQISDLHVFDLLINNFDRYQLREYGRNVQWNHQQFVSLDNGASFQPLGELTAAIPARKIQVIGRFSRSMIFALRNMDTERARTFMFPPNEHFDDDSVFEFFLQRRQMVLDHVDQMIVRYGERTVLSLP